MMNDNRTGPASTRGPRSGFTLIELMVVIAVAAILLAIAVPSFTAMGLNSKLRSTANNLVASAYLARSEAIKLNTPVTLCSSGNGTTCGGDWREGWIITRGGEVVQHQGAAPGGFLVEGSRASISFQPSGVGTDAASFTICRSRPSVGPVERVVSISSTGRPAVETTTIGSCP